MVFSPLLAGIVLIALPFISNRGERSPRRRPWAIASVLIIVLMIATLWVHGLNSPWSQFQSAAIAAIGRGHNHRPRLHWCAIISDQRLFELSCDWKRRWPTRSGLNYVASRLPKSQLILRISNGGGNMPAYAANLTQADMDALVAFLETRKIQHR